METLPIDCGPTPICVARHEGSSLWPGSGAMSDAGGMPTDLRENAQRLPDRGDPSAERAPYLGVGVGDHP